MNLADWFGFQHRILGVKPQIPTKFYEHKFDSFPLSAAYHWPVFWQRREFFSRELLS